MHLIFYVYEPLHQIRLYKLKDRAYTKGVDIGSMYFVRKHTEQDGKVFSFFEINICGQRCSAALCLGWCGFFYALLKITGAPFRKCLLIL